MLGHHFPLIVTENAYVRLCHHYISFTYTRHPLRHWVDVLHILSMLYEWPFSKVRMSKNIYAGGYNLRHDFTALNEVLSNLCRLWHARQELTTFNKYTLPSTWKCLLSFVWWDGIEMLNLRLTLNIILFHIKYLSKNSEKCHIQKSWSVYYIPEAQGLRL